jgi:hypothetical protein
MNIVRNILLTFQVTNLVNDRKFIVVSVKFGVCRIYKAVDDEMLHQIHGELRKHKFSVLVGVSIRTLRRFTVRSELQNLLRVSGFKM